jgi:hypothetical protein
MPKASHHRSKRYRRKQRSRRPAHGGNATGASAPAAAGAQQPKLQPQEYRVFDNTPDDTWVATIPPPYRVKADNGMFAKDIGALAPEQMVRFFRDVIAANKWNDRHILEARGTKSGSVYFEDGKVISIVPSTS